MTVPRTLPTIIYYLSPEVVIAPQLIFRTGTLLLHMREFFVSTIISTPTPNNLTALTVLTPAETPLFAYHGLFRRNPACCWNVFTFLGLHKNIGVLFLCTPVFYDNYLLVDRVADDVMLHVHVPRPPTAETFLVILIVFSHSSWMLIFSSTGCVINSFNCHKIEVRSPSWAAPRIIRTRMTLPMLLS